MPQKTERPPPPKKKKTTTKKQKTTNKQTNKLTTGIYCTSNGTQFFVFKIFHEGFFTLKICMRIDISKP